MQKPDDKALIRVVDCGFFDKMSAGTIESAKCLLKRKKEVMDSNKAIPESEEKPTPSSAEKPRSSRGAVSPPWSWQIKLVVVVLLLGGAIALAVKYNNYLQLFLTAMLISFLIQPVVRWIHKHTKMNWKLISALLYLIILGLLVWGLFSGGRGLVGQITGLFKTLQENVGAFTDFLAGLSNQTVHVGPLEFKTPDINTKFITEKINEFVQPLVGEITKNMGRMLGSVGSFLFNLVTVILVSFFITAESGGQKKPFLNIKNQEFNYDLRRMGREISDNFNAFLRGTFTVVLIAIVVYSALLGALGVPYYFLLAVIAGFGRFIPYLGAFIGWVGFAIGALIQNPTPFGLTPFVYMLLVLGVSLFIDVILDHLVTPSVMSEALDVHPAAILISALVGGQMFGLLGVILAAPAYAVLTLLVRYLVRKLFDEDPWEGMVYYRKPPEAGVIKFLRKWGKRFWQWTEKPRQAISAWFVKLWGKIAGFFKKLFAKLPKSKRKKQDKGKEESPDLDSDGKAQE